MKGKGLRARRTVFKIEVYSSRSLNAIPPFGAPDAVGVGGGTHVRMPRAQGAALRSLPSTDAPAPRAPRVLTQAPAGLAR